MLHLEFGLGHVRPSRHLCSPDWLLAAGCKEGNVAAWLACKAWLGAARWRMTTWSYVIPYPIFHYRYQGLGEGRVVRLEPGQSS